MRPVMVGRGMVEGTDLPSGLPLCLQGRQVAEPGRQVHEDADRVDIGIREHKVQHIGGMQIPVGVGWAKAWMSEGDESG